jgi:hypothetical protein
MTITSLLRHVGINVPRFVTVDGAIVFDRPKPTLTTVSTATALQPHRFHGGEDPSPQREDYTSAWWNTDNDARERDIEAMKTSFPGFEVIDSNGDLAYGGIIDTGRGRFPLLLMPQVDGSLPTAVTKSSVRLGRQEGRYWRKAPHLYLSGALCIADSRDWHPGDHTTATAGAWAAHWFAAYTEWRMSGVWPTDGYGIVA